MLVPDNTKTAVIKACLYDPQVNRTYAEMAAHYDTAILPARPRRPRDKAKVEQAVLIVEMRHQIGDRRVDLRQAVKSSMAQPSEKPSFNDEYRLLDFRPANVSASLVKWRCRNAPPSRRRFD